MDAKKLLEDNKIKATPLREKIIKILNSSKAPLSYDEILSQINANKTTFYRNMELFESSDIVIKTENNHKSYYELANETKAYFFCDICKQITNIEVPAISDVNKVKSVIIKGICKNCNL
ncbi:MAG: transcriptional repressor [Campylobacter sputorum]|uniref:Fur family transcriptional regulator n=1 Tax=Campylobacter sputorum TaxID=206 RepID=UPI000B788BF1|nr:transcriptional repressor [Campylobacter sputorum]ASM37813.1 transcriptional regulator, Fur family [Campylobacter sputorum bv. paraureolyticus LMG 11764]MDY6119888.1 transcriptional repressor [Campylobacter sputorum]